MSVFRDMSSLWKMLPFQGPGDQSCSAPFCLARQLWLSRTWDLEHRCQVKFSTLKFFLLQKNDPCLLKCRWHNSPTGMSCSVCSTTWTMRTRWRSEGCKPWTHLAFLSWWKMWAQWASVRLTHFQPLSRLDSGKRFLLALVWKESLMAWPDRNLCWVDCPTIARSRTNCLQWTRSCGWCTLQGITLKILLEILVQPLEGQTWLPFPAIPWRSRQTQYQPWILKSCSLPTPFPDYPFFHGASSTRWEWIGFCLMPF